MEIRRFGPGHRRAEGPPGTKGVSGAQLLSDERAVITEVAFGPYAMIQPHSNQSNTALFIVISGGGFVRTLPGCVPAWRPDGVLTVALRDEIVRFRVCPDGRRDTCTRTLIPRAELVRAARLHPTGPALAPLRVLVDGVAWLSSARAAILVSIRLTGRFAGMGPMSAIAFFEDGRLAKTQPFFRVTGGTLGAGPRGSYVTLIPDVILRPDGSQVSLPQHLREARDFAWSPDERFLAIAGRFAVVLVDVRSLERYDRTGGGLRTVTVPQPAARLDWR